MNGSKGTLDASLCRDCEALQRELDNERQLRVEAQQRCVGLRSQAEATKQALSTASDAVQREHQNAVATLKQKVLQLEANARVNARKHSSEITALESQWQDALERSLSDANNNTMLRTLLRKLRTELKESKQRSAETIAAIRDSLEEHKTLNAELQAQIRRKTRECKGLQTALRDETDRREELASRLEDRLHSQADDEASVASEGLSWQESTIGGAHSRRSSFGESLAVQLQQATEGASYVASDDDDFSEDLAASAVQTPRGRLSAADLSDVEPCTADRSHLDELALLLNKAIDYTDEYRHEATAQLSTQIEDSLQQSALVHSEHQKQLEALEQQLERSRQQVEQNEADHADLAKQLEHSKQEVQEHSEIQQQLHRDVRNLELQRHDSAKRCAALEAELARLSEELHAARHSLENAEAQHEQFTRDAAEMLRAANAIGQKHKQEHDDAVQTFDAERTRYEMEVSELNAQCAAARGEHQRELERASGLDAELGLLKAELAEAQAAKDLAERQAQSQTADALAKQSGSAGSVAARQQAEYESLQAKFDLHRTRHEQEIQEFEAAKHELEQRLRKLTEQLSNLREQRSLSEEECYHVEDIFLRMVSQLTGRTAMPTSPRVAADSTNEGQHRKGKIARRYDRYTHRRYKGKGKTCAIM